MKANDPIAEVENFKILRSIWKNTYDKILEIKVMNRRSWNESKKAIIEEEKKKIDHKYDKEYQEQYITNKIQVSEARNNSNITKMKKRSELMLKLESDTLVKIKNFAKPDNEKYRDLIQKLVLQGMVKLLEPVCLVQIRKCDEDFVKKLLKNCENDFSRLMKDQTGEEYKCTLEIDNTFLTNEA
jgi:V-type H+-transporting ATPase subunit E